MDSIKGKALFPWTQTWSKIRFGGPLTFSIALLSGSLMLLVKNIRRGKRVRFAKEHQIHLVDKDPVQKGTARLYIKLPSAWNDAGVLGCVTGRMWKDIPTNKVSTSSGDMHVAEVYVAEEPEDDSKPFLEFMVTNKRGLWEKAHNGGNYCIQWPGRYLLADGCLRELEHGPDEKEGGIVFAKELDDDLPPAPPVSRKPSLLSMALKPAIKSPSPIVGTSPSKGEGSPGTRSATPMQGMSPSASSHAIFTAAVAAVAAAEAKEKELALTLDIEALSSDLEEQLSKFAQCGTPPKKSAGRPPRPAPPRSLAFC
ncbi:hypothetical protein CEUSTIGMA_g1883.t1 [Chlamydomonas eustigma]|uniref:Uncharacterized protein n=1 Tax=Chlamydomonas eustigma TaxID=1157962 RepID=A0A250WUD0_9CHLO|nr:hypothetical protein CEUSTIGMA_g1883.t1 [Chlamydomonas eustigma]|eukprot:GAX74434.1 hypothetical protein CEUSTIGMA_g1883.t1 [Chlamydomonas eustigma]